MCSSVEKILPADAFCYIFSFPSGNLLFHLSVQPKPLTPAMYYNNVYACIVEANTEGNRLTGYCIEIEMENIRNGDVQIL
jgi:hypothetical protein